jgi:toxin ParE1/3/4
MRVVFHPEAEAEMLEAAQFYNRKVRGLGAEFLDAIDAAKVAVLQEPFRWRVIEQDVRRYLMPRFPFAILYRVLPDRLRILAVKHHSRHPDYWRERLEN